MPLVFHYMALGFASLFAAMMLWMGYLAVTGKVSDDDDDGGPVSGWGTPKG